MKILVIGFGSIGTRHASNLSNKVQLGIFDSDEKKLNNVNKNINTLIFSNFREALDWKPDGVIVSTPAETHFQVAKKLIKNKIKFILIEKPVTIKVNQALYLKKFALKYKCSLFVVTNLRFHKPVVLLKKNIKSIGKILFSYSYFGHELLLIKNKKNFTKKNNDNFIGVLMDSIHEIDYLHWFFGNSKKINSFKTKLSLLNINKEDLSFSILKHKKSISFLKLDYLQKFKRRGCEIVGTKGTLIWESYGKNREISKVYLLKKKNNKEIKKILLNKEINTNIQYIELVKNFILSIKGKKSVLASIDDGIAALKVANS